MPGSADHRDRVIAIVINVRHKQEADTYCGRPGPWGNPFRVSRNNSRQQAIEQHQDWLNTRIKAGIISRQQLAALTEQPHGRDGTIGCWCAPQPCHAHTLARYSLAARDGQQALEATMTISTIDWLAQPA